MSANTTPDATATPRTDAQDWHKHAANDIHLEYLTDGSWPTNDRVAAIISDHDPSAKTSAGATPRTDEAVQRRNFGSGDIDWVSVKHARTLERELTSAQAALTAAKAEIARLERDLEFVAAVRDRHIAMFNDEQARADRAEAELRERTQWICACSGTDCAGQAENERLRAEVERLKAQDGFHWNIIKGCMDELEMVDMGPSMIRGEIQEWKCSHERVKAKEVAATDRAVLLAVERDQLRARVADLENDLEKSKHDADDWHRAWETVTEQAKKEVRELEADKARLDWLSTRFPDDDAGDCDPEGIERKWMSVWENSTEGSNLRAAIDAARAGKGAT